MVTTPRRNDSRRMLRNQSCATLEPKRCWNSSRTCSHRSRVSTVVWLDRSGSNRGAGPLISRLSRARRRQHRLEGSRSALQLQRLLVIGNQLERVVDRLARLRFVSYQTVQLGNFDVDVRAFTLVEHLLLVRQGLRGIRSVFGIHRRVNGERDVQLEQGLREARECAQGPTQLAVQVAPERIDLDRLL